MHLLTYTPQKRAPWNKGKLVGQKPPLKLKEIWAIRIRLQIANRIRDLALFNLAIDSNNAQFAIMQSSLSTPVVDIRAIPLPIAA